MPLKDYFHIFALPWCCVIPISIGLFGLAGGALSSILSRLTPLFLVISIILIGYSNYRVWILKHGPIQTKVWVSIITAISILLWLWSIIFVMEWIKF